ncbi:hypothetical protein [Undibacterium flavidum]|uniref:Lipoprotein n=1 Tax=Undibacterium flavidum TaxID=2762297 RepID=A0ABR6YB92_9BURK|nr:hypothetical protein [Undibacterium flavidum]MBC3873414.1 hypothetical protein [Undibacterium flavidum]
MTSTRPVSIDTCFTFASIIFTIMLTACNSNSDSDRRPDPVTKIDKTNMVDAAAVTMLAYRRSMADTSVIATAGFRLIIEDKANGQHPCAKGGHLQLEKVGSDYLFTPINCDLGDYQLISGKLLINIASGYFYQFTSLNYRLNGDTNSQSLTGQLKSTISGSQSSTSGYFSVERNKRNDVYQDYSITSAGTNNAKDSMRLSINTPRFPHSLNAEYDIASDTLNAKVQANDGSQLSMLVAKAGTITLELHQQASGAVLASKTLSAAEMTAAITKITE